MSYIITKTDGIPNIRGKWGENGTNNAEVPENYRKSGFGDGHIVGSGVVNTALAIGSAWQTYSEKLARRLAETGVLNGLKLHYDGVVAGVGVFSLWGEKIKIGSPIISSSYFTVLGDYVDSISEGDVITILGSTGNDGDYTVTDVQAGGVAPSTIVTSIYVDPVLPSAVADGYAYTGGRILTRYGSVLNVPPKFSVITATLPAGAGTIRDDYVDFIYAESTNTLTFYIREGASGIYAPQPDHQVVGKILSKNDSGTYDCIRCETSSRPYEAKNTIIVGDGIRSFHSEPLDRDNPIQDAINKVNNRGGGIVYWTGGDLYYKSNNVYMKSNVVLNCLGNKILIDSSIQRVRIEGMNTDTASIGATGNITLSSYDFNDYGVGSVLEITSGADSGKRLIISEIESSSSAICREYDYSVPSLTISGSESVRIYLSNASIINTDVLYTGLASTTKVINASETINCHIENVQFVSDVACVNPFMLIQNCIGFEITNVKDNSSFLISIRDSATGNIENCSITGCHLPNVALYFSTTINSIFSGNICTTAPTLGSGWLTASSAYYPDDGPIYFGDSQDTSIQFRSFDSQLLLDGNVTTSGDLSVVDHLEVDGTTQFNNTTDVDGDFSVSSGNTVLINSTATMVNTIIDGDFSVTAGAGNTSTFNSLVFVNDFASFTDSSQRASFSGGIRIAKDKLLLLGTDGGDYAEIEFDDTTKSIRITGVVRGSYEVTGSGGSSAFTYYADGVPVKTYYDSRVYDGPGSYRYSTVSGRFTADRNMTVTLSASLSATPNGATSLGDSLRLYCKINGVSDVLIAKQILASGITGSVVINGSYDLYLSSGSFFEIYALSSGIDMTEDTVGTHIQFHEISAG